MGGHLTFFPDKRLQGARSHKIYLEDAGEQSRCSSRPLLVAMRAQGRMAGNAMQSMLRAGLIGCEDQGAEFVLLCMLEIVSTWFSFSKKSFKSIW